MIAELQSLTKSFRKMVGGMWGCVIYVPVEVARMLILPVCMWIHLITRGCGLLIDLIPRSRCLVGIVPGAVLENLPVCCSLLAVCGYITSLSYFSLGMTCSCVYFFAVWWSGQTVSSQSAPHRTNEISPIVVVLILSILPKYMLLMYILGLFIYKYTEQAVISTDASSTEPISNLPLDVVDRRNQVNNQRIEIDNNVSGKVNVSTHFESADTVCTAGIVSGGVNNMFDMKNNDISGNFDPFSLDATLIPSGTNRRGGDEESTSNDGSNTGNGMTGQVTAGNITGPVLTRTDVRDNNIKANVQNSTVSGSLLEALNQNDLPGGQNSSQGTYINIVDSGKEDKESEMRKLIETVNITQRTISDLQSQIEAMITDNKSFVFNIQEMCLGPVSNLNNMIGQIRAEENKGKEDIQTLTCEMNALSNTYVPELKRGIDTVTKKLGQLDGVSDTIQELPHQLKDLDRRIQDMSDKLQQQLTIQTSMIERILEQIKEKNVDSVRVRNDSGRHTVPSFFNPFSGTAQGSGHRHSSRCPNCNE